LEKEGYKQEGDYQIYRSNYREDEEAIFSKMREMKESIINNDCLRPSLGKPSSQLGERAEIGRKEYDPRVENIDKINSKIKQILNCLT
jgi:hypothetical protein